MNITAHLFRGADRPTTLGTLSEKLGISRRECEARVQAARLEGEAICSGPRGLWLAQTHQEQAQQAVLLHNRAVHQLATAAAQKAAAELWALREAKVEALTLGFEEAA